MNGILLIDKPSGWTSSDVVAKLRGVLHERRVGHSGTLDPMATGLLVVFVGRATRAVEFAEAQEKQYLAEMRLGLVTDTQDSTGNRIGGKFRPVPDDELQAVLARFRGPIQQVPPMYSAVKIGGKKLYEIARRGGEVERKPREITISELRVLGRDEETVRLSVSCSKGTYIRTLCHDIGAALGCGACMSALRRTGSGAFALADAHTLEEVQRMADQGRAEELLLPVDTLFSHLPALTVGLAEEKKIRNGSQVSLNAADGLRRVYASDGSFLAVCRVEDGRLKTVKSFFEV